MSGCASPKWASFRPNPTQVKLNFASKHPPFNEKFNEPAATRSQMDKFVPRGEMGSHVLSIWRETVILLPSSSKAFAFPPFAVAHFLHSVRFSRKSHMEKDSHQDEMDQMRECCAKGACELNSRKKVSDDIMPHILNLYGSCATPHDFEIYAPDASFEDPLMCAHGVKQIKSAFYSLSKVFSESRIVEYTVKEHFMAPGKQEILIDNKQYYKFLGRNIDMISLIKLYVEDGKVVRHEDWWDKKPLSNRQTAKYPLVGRLNEVVRRGSMLATHAMMRFGKDPTT